ncbi:MAG: hypothetical protein WBH96_06335 [Dysgonamonadaceae bacterium]
MAQYENHAKTTLRGFLFAPHANQSGSLQESCAASPEGRQYEAKGVAGNGKV